MQLIWIRELPKSVAKRTKLLPKIATRNEAVRKGLRISLKIRLRSVAIRKHFKIANKSDRGDAINAIREKINDANDLSLYLLSEANVALVTGAAFGAPKCIRLSYAASEEELIEAIRRIKEALLKLS